MKKIIFDKSKEGFDKAAAFYLYLTQNYDRKQWNMKILPTMYAFYLYREAEEAINNLSDILNSSQQ